MLILKIVEFTLVTILGIAVLYILVFGLAGLFYHDPPLSNEVRKKRIVVLIPGYKEDAVIIDTAQDALRQNYPRELFDVVVIADSFSRETLENLAKMDLKLVEVSFEKSTKAKALNRAMELLEGSWDLAVILDADNLMEPDFLLKINSAFSGDVYAVQGHRVAKNTNTGLAVLDAASEEINNHIFRKGHRVLGLSAALIGSGMAFGYEIFKELMAGVKAVGGFDKEIELKLLRDGHLIEYLDTARVYDEKVQKAEVFGNQRRRWLSAQLYYFRKDFPAATAALLGRGNIDYFDKAFQFIQPPRILLIGAVPAFGLLFSLASIFIMNDFLSLWLWSGLTAACITAFLVSLPHSFYNRKTLRALSGLPAGVLLMIRSLLKIKGANTTFIHTSHSQVSINDNK